MLFTMKLADGRSLIVEKAFWTGKTVLRLNNAIIGKMGFQRQAAFKIKDKDQNEHSLEIKHPILDPMPIVLFDGKDLLASKRFNKFQTTIICLPALLILQLGAIPALIGIASVYLNFFIARYDNCPKELRWTAVGIVPVIGFLIIAFTHDLVWNSVNGEKKSKFGYHLKTKAPTRQYDPSEDDRDSRQWARPNPKAEEMERWVREGK